MCRCSGRFEIAPDDSRRERDFLVPGTDQHTKEGAAISSVPEFGGRRILGHPIGLAYIVFTEAFERFSFYGMQALLVLYMADHLLHPDVVRHVIGFGVFHHAIEAIFGKLSIEGLATQIFGLYVGLIYFAPVLGGLAGDRVFGQRKAVALGAILMAIGHFMMAFEAAFLFALLALIVGAGLLKGNLAAQVGALYKKSDQNRDAAYSIYTVSINVGAFLAPLVCGSLGEIYGWQYGFGAAGIGMLVGLAIYLAGGAHLPPDIAPASRGSALALSRDDWRIIAALFLLFLIAALFWTAQSQVWDTYPLWIRDHVDRRLFGFTIPITWFQSLDSFAVLAMAPVILLLWKKQRERKAEPGDLTKIVIGCLLFAAACAWIGLGQALSGSNGHVSLVWPCAFHFICAWGYIYVAPIMLALVSRSAPASVNAMLVGSYYLSIFVGGIASGWLGHFYEIWPVSDFWFLHAGIVATGGAVILLLRAPLIAALNLETAP
jgi:POT family proton-dependent oligopeptide transporter